jgi:hypothetical protein
MADSLSRTPQHDRQQNTNTLVNSRASHRHRFHANTWGSGSSNQQLILRLHGSCRARQGQTRTSFQGGVANQLPAGCLQLPCHRTGLSQQDGQGHHKVRPLQPGYQVLRKAVVVPSTYSELLMIRSQQANEPGKQNAWPIPPGCAEHYRSGDYGEASERELLIPFYSRAIPRLAYGKRQLAFLSEAPHY